MERMKLVVSIFPIVLVVCSLGQAQEFDAVAIKGAPPQNGHFRAPAASTGGPGTEDPALFRCSNCTVAFLISKAFGLERYQFPGQSGLSETAYEVSARIPLGTEKEQFQVMLQNLLKERFHLAYHFEKKQLQGYELVVGKNGPKLKESAATSAVKEEGWHGSGAAGHSGTMSRAWQGKYNADHKTMQELAQMISTQLAKPVDDHTGLTGKYDIALNWNDDGAHAASHPGGWSGGGGDHGGGGGQGSTGASTDSATGATLVGAVQSQLGLKLEPKKATANVFVVDGVDKSPTEN